jgi:hypothetical protein
MLALRLRTLIAGDVVYDWVNKVFVCLTVDD